MSTKEQMKFIQQQNERRIHNIQKTKGEWNIADLTKEELLERIQYDVHITRMHSKSTASYVGWMLSIQVIGIVFGIVAVIAAAS
jgi:hypothetical protein